MSDTYQLVDGGRAIRCMKCSTTSHNPSDLQQRYCGFCHRFHVDAEEVEALRRAVDSLEQGTTEK